jgi:hypothetical protein
MLDEVPQGAAGLVLGQGLPAQVHIGAGIEQ